MVQNEKSQGMHAATRNTRLYSNLTPPNYDNEKWSILISSVSHYFYWCMQQSLFELLRLMVLHYYLDLEE
jgi:hypothetical protein